MSSLPMDTASITETSWVRHAIGSREDNISRNELLIFITPRVIRSVEEGIRLSRDFEERVSQLKARMRETQGIRLKVEPVLPVPNPAEGIPPAAPPR